MKFLLSIILVAAFVAPSQAQIKKREKVKRKYRQEEAVSKDLQPVFLRGYIRDLDKNRLPGARVIIIGTKKMVHSNEKGEYFFYQYETGKVRIQASLEGYETKWVDVILQSGQNFFNLSLPENEAKIEKEVGLAQNRPQQVLDMPFSNSVLDETILEQNHISTFKQIADFIPGVVVKEYGFEKNILSIRGITNDYNNSFGFPLISSQFNSVPTNNKFGTNFEYFDMQRIEVLRGAQATLQGRGSVMGSVLFESNKPTQNTEGSISAGVGNFNQNEIEGMVNIPIFKDKLAVRAAGIYSNNSGYIENTLGKNLNGKNSIAGRVSTRFTPNPSHQLDLIIGYQKRKYPGIGFMNMDFPNENGQKSPFFYTTSLNIDEQQKRENRFFDATLIYKYFRHEHNYWTSTSNFRKTQNDTNEDGDGTLAPALSFSENLKLKQFFQQISYNFSRSNNRLNGIMGGNFKYEKGENVSSLFINEQNFYPVFFNTGELIDASGNYQPIVEVTDSTNILSGTVLPESHSESKNIGFNNLALEGFLDFSYQFWRKFAFSAGVRGMADRTKLSYLAQLNEGEQSVLGKLTGKSPNIFYLPSSEKELKKTTLSLAYRGSLQYFFREHTTAYFTYSKSRQPRIVDFTDFGEEVDEKGIDINHFELGIKTHYKSRIGLKTAIFYYEMKNYPTEVWQINADSTDVDLVFENTGQAANYGAEASLQWALSKELTLFGNYSYLFTRHDSLTTNGNEQSRTGQMFTLSPEHSLQIGMNAQLAFGDYLILFARPVYNYQTDMILYSSLTQTINQKAHGILNGTAGFNLPKYRINFMVYGTNLLGEKYIEVAESRFMSNVQFPGAPRMFGTKLTWKF